MSDYPGSLDEIIALFSGMPDEEKRSLLISYAESSAACAPADGEQFDLEDVRKDEECTDTVGVFLRVRDGTRATFRVTLGPQVQTLTRAMAAILCKGLDGASPQEVIDCPADFVPKLTGAELVRQRSQTVYYVLGRMKGAAKVWLNRERARL